MNRETMSLPMVALRGVAVLPEMVRHFDVSREKSLKAIEEAMEGNQKIFLSAQKERSSSALITKTTCRASCRLSLTSSASR